LLTLIRNLKDRLSNILSNDDASNLVAWVVTIADYEITTIHLMQNINSPRRVVAPSSASKHLLLSPSSAPKILDTTIELNHRFLDYLISYVLQPSKLCLSKSCGTAGTDAQTAQLRVSALLVRGPNRSLATVGELGPSAMGATAQVMFLAGIVVAEDTGKQIPKCCSSF
jgi:hypothetical protein